LKGTFTASQQQSRTKQTSVLQSAQIRTRAAAVSSAQQQISSTLQVHNLCKTNLEIIIHKTDTLSELFSADKNSAANIRLTASAYGEAGISAEQCRNKHVKNTCTLRRYAYLTRESLHLLQIRNNHNHHYYENETSYL